MSWIHAGLASAAILAVVNIIDSHLVSRRFPSLRVFLLLLGVIYLLYGVALSVITPLPQHASGSALRLALLSSALRAGAMFILLDALRHREVCAVVPVVYSYPVLVAVIAFIALGEHLVWRQWLAVVAVASGAVAITLNWGSERALIGRRRSMLILLAGALFAVADVSGKQALDEISHWNLFWISALMMSALFLIISLRPAVVRQAHALSNRSRALGLVLLNETIAPAGMVISYWALERGPVSLVSTLLSTRPLFVLLFALILSRFAPGFLVWGGGRRVMALRLAAAVMIVAGIAVIELS